MQREGGGGPFQRKEFSNHRFQDCEKMMLCAVNGQSSAQQSWHAKAEEANAVCVDQTVANEDTTKEFMVRM